MEKQAKIKPVWALKKSKWIGGPLAVLGLVCGLLLGSCGAIRPVPIETDTQVHVKDSTILHIKDSIRIHEATRYKDLAWLGDTLQIEGQRSRMWAVADTTKEVLIGGLEEDKVEEKTKIIYKDKIVYKDSLVYQDRPIPVEVVKEIVPKFWRIIGIFGLVCFTLLSAFTGFKVYRFFKFRK